MASSMATAADDVLTLVRVRKLAASGRARSIRLAAGLSLYDIAGAIGSTASTVQRWELGDRRAYGDAALRWCALLDALERQRQETA
jgi:transcriptional regulator with XRE-family HTH domain